MLALATAASAVLAPPLVSTSALKSQPQLPLKSPGRTRALRAQGNGDFQSDMDDENEQSYLADLERALTQPAERDRRRQQLDDGAPLRIQRQRVPAPLRIQRNTERLRRRRRGSAPTLTREDTALVNLPTTLRRSYDDFLERPGQPLLLGSLALLVGFYLAGALSTIFGAAGFWEPTIAFVPLTLGELVSRRYYSRPMGERSQTLRLLNALKCGFLFGVVTDALKLAG